MCLLGNFTSTSTAEHSVLLVSSAGFIETMHALVMPVSNQAISDSLLTTDTGATTRESAFWIIANLVQTLATNNIPLLEPLLPALESVLVGNDVAAVPGSQMYMRAFRAFCGMVTATGQNEKRLQKHLPTALLHFLQVIFLPT
jgi:hypothetical protein